MTDYPDWLFNSIPLTHPSLESTTSVLSYDTIDDGQDTVRDTTTKKPTCKKFPVKLLNVKGVLHQIGRVFKQYNIAAYFKPINTLCQLLVRLKDIILKERVVGPEYYIPCDS